MAYKLILYAVLHVAGTQVCHISKECSLRIYGNRMLIFGRKRGGGMEEKDGENCIMRSQTLICLSDQRGLDGAGV